MRARTRLWIDAGIALAAFLGAAQQLLQKERIAGGPFDACRRPAGASMNFGRQSFVGRSGPRSIVANGLPASLARQASSSGSPSRREVMIRRPGPSHGARSPPDARDLRFGPVQVLDDQQAGERRPAGDQRVATPRLPRLRAALSIAS